jgi:Flp pilus assembly protein TadG
MSARVGSRGSVSIEAVLLIPLFLMTLFIIMEASLWIHASSVAQAAAQDGARAATVLGGYEQDGKRTAEEVLFARDVGDEWRITTQATTQSFTVIISGNATSVIPGWTWEVHESATMPWEGGPR